LNDKQQNPAQQTRHESASHNEEVAGVNDTNNKSLYWSVFSAFLVALLIYFTIVLPVEFGRDPFGTGKFLGLTVLTKEANLNSNNTEDIDQNNTKTTDNQDEFQARNDTVKVLVPAGRGVEYKFEMKKHSRLTYKWQTDGPQLYFDFHGEPEGDTTGFFESFAISTASNAEGMATIPFDGVQGWYWKNNSEKDIQVTLETQGTYQIKGLLQ
jgi:hypothetical protein